MTGEEIVRRYKEDGYVIIPGVISRPRRASSVKISPHICAAEKSSKASTSIRLYPGSAPAIITRSGGVTNRPGHKG